MNVSICISTYGDSEWEDLAWNHAWPSASAEHPSELLVFHDPQGTIASVRNELGKQAKSEWLLFLDADDSLAPGYLDAMRRAVEQRDDGPCLLTPAVSLVRRGKPGPATFFDRGKSLRDDNWLVLGTLIQRSLFLEIGGFGEYQHGWEDFALWSKAWRIGAKVVKVPEAVYLYHVNPQSQHRRIWRDRVAQKREHQRVVAELDAWEETYKSVGVL